MKFLFIITTFLSVICIEGSSIPNLMTDAGMHFQTSKNEKQFCFFTPPEKWIPNVSEKSETVQIEFYTKGEKELHPSINLAVENINISAKEYLQAVKTIHTSHKGTEWRDLGKMETLAGSAFLTELDIPSQYGPTRQLQLILIKNSKAYIVTACALKDEFSKFYKEFQNSFKSLTITPDPISYLKDAKKKEMLLKLKHPLKALAIKNPKDFESEAFKTTWKPFQDFVISECSEMGAYWQIVVLKGTKEDLL